jgi:hypothetical protein
MVRRLSGVDPDHIDGREAGDPRIAQARCGLQMAKMRKIELSLLRNETEQLNGILILQHAKKRDHSAENDHGLQPHGTDDPFMGIVSERGQTSL